MRAKCPPELERIVDKTLTKNCEERYQSAKDLLIDLRNLKRKLEVDAEIDRTGSADFQRSESAGTNVSDKSSPATDSAASSNRNRWSIGCCFEC